jgi:hypothetical protein
VPDHKHHKVTIDAGIRLHEHVSVVKRTGDRFVGFVETERQDVSQSGAHLIDGEVHTQLSGSTPQNEADSLIVAAILVAKLNSLGARWCAPTLASEPADCEAQDQSSPRHILRIQITRPSLGSVWRDLSVEGSVDVISDESELLAAVKAAIDKKVGQYSAPDRARLLLALDANRVPALTLDPVRERLLMALGPVCARSGFASIWVVGPTPEITYALSGSA